MFRVWFPVINNDSRVEPSVAALYLSSALKDQSVPGFEGDVAECRMDFIGVSLYRAREGVSSFRPDLVAITVGNLTYSFLKEFIKLLRGLFPLVKTVIGGAGVTPCPVEILKGTGADIAIIGEGEVPFRRCVETLAREKKGDLKDTTEPLIKIPGVFVRSGGLVHRGPNSFCVTPTPDNLLKNFRIDTDLFLSFYERNDIKILPFSISRGCRNVCSFCFHGQEGGRSLSLEKAEEALLRLVEKIRPRQVVLTDLNFDPSLDLIKNILPILKSIRDKYNITYEISISAGALLQRADSGKKEPKREVIQKLLDSGVTSFCIGFENASDAVLLQFRKLQSRALENINLIKYLSELPDVEDVHLDVIHAGVLSMPSHTMEHLRVLTPLFFEDRKVSIFDNSTVMPVQGSMDYRLVAGILKRYPGYVGIWKESGHLIELGEEGDFHWIFTGAVPLDWCVGAAVTIYEHAHAHVEKETEFLGKSGGGRLLFFASVLNECSRINRKIFHAYAKEEKINFPPLFEEEHHLVNNYYGDLLETLSSLKGGYYVETLKYVDQIAEKVVRETLFDSIDGRLRLKNIFIEYAKLHPIFLGERESRWYQEGLGRSKTPDFLKLKRPARKDG